jgi:hypothetical protein
MTEPPIPPGTADSCGWLSDLPTFYGAQPRVVRLKLEQFVRNAGTEQVRAWDESIPWLQRECRELVDAYDAARTYTTILEYELPREERRPDVIVLENGVVVVLELKGKAVPSQADIDQVFAYARDLRSYHRECADRPVHAVLVPSRGEATPREVDGVQVVGPAGVDRLLLECTRESAAGPLTPEAFLARDAYAPLPSLVRAARDLFAREPLPFIKRARAATEPAVACITDIARRAAARQTRHLVLLTGVPGSGKTLVGLQLVHAGFLDDLAVPRARNSKPPAPAVFLSGNHPLVLVLQDALKDAGGGGKVFVRDVKDYVRYYSRRSDSIPPEHLLVFDEAQRAWDADHVRRKNNARGASADAESADTTAAAARSEPEHFVEFAERIPRWCVIVGLVGSGQEIHAGEEGGLVQWRRALEGCRDPDAWTVHAPPGVAEVFSGSRVRADWAPALNLDTEIRFHLAPRLHEFVEILLGDGPPEAAAPLADEMYRGGLRLYLTRDLETARGHARELYAGMPDRRFGLLASSKDKDLPQFGVDNTYFATSRVSRHIGRWYNAPQDDPESCCRLDSVATEFSAQGMELDLAILAWGSDYVRRDGRWTISRAGRTNHARDQHRLRQNVYRVLLTRGRDGTVIFMPPGEWHEETVEFLVRCGVRSLESPSLRHHNKH